MLTTGVPALVLFLWFPGASMNLKIVSIDGGESEATPPSWNFEECLKIVE